MSLRVRDLFKRHGKSQPVLAGVSLDVRPGSLMAIMGRSGAGKTTLLRCLVGLDRFDAGSVEIGDVSVRAGGAASRVLRGLVGMMFQSLELFPHLTVLDNCTLAPRHVLKMDRRKAEDRARTLLGELGVDDKRGDHPSVLSGGQRQRVALARALCMEPRALVYDEPTSALDAASRADVCQLFQRMRQRGIPQLMVVHDPNMAREVADEVIWLEGGRVARQGSPAEVLVDHV